MRDSIWLIHSDAYGNPSPGSTEGHWVRVSDNPNLTIGNQLTGDGLYPHADCGEEDVKGVLADRRIVVDEITIEHEANAGAQGTFAPQLVQALADNGVSAQVVNGDPPQGYIGNPLGGRVLPPSDFPAYLAASQHQYVSIDTPSGDPMTTEEKLAQARAQVTALYAIVGRDAETGDVTTAEIDGWAAPAAEGQTDVFGMTQAFLRTPGISDLIHKRENAAPIDLTAGLAAFKAELAKAAADLP